MFFEWGPASGPGVYRFACITWFVGADRGLRIDEQEIGWQYVGEADDIPIRLADYIAAGRTLRDAGWIPDETASDRHAQKIAAMVVNSLRHGDNPRSVPGVVGTRVFLTLVDEAEITIGDVPVKARLSDRLERRFVERAWIAMSPRVKNLA